MSIEQKIAKLLEDSIKLKALKLQEADETKKKSKKEEADESDEEEADESDEDEATEGDKPKFDFSKLKKKSMKEELDLEDYTLEELEDFMISEDFEELDELSKKTLGSYVRAAKDDRSSNRSVAKDSEKYAKDSDAHQKSERAIANFAKGTAEYHKFAGNDTSDPDEKIDHAIDHVNATARRKASITRALAHRSDSQSYANDKRTYDNLSDRRTKGMSLAAKKILTKESADVQEDVDALLFGEDLSEEFREKASVIFEAAVMNRVNSEIETLEESLIEAYETRLQEEFQEIQEELEDKVDAYLGYIAEQWVKENELSIQKSLKSEILEGFVEGMKNLFQEHYIDVPDEQFDVVGDLHDTINQLETKLDESLEYNVEMRTQISTMIREGLVEDFCKELTDTEVEKFKSLSEELSYSSKEAFTSKLEIIKENYFSKKTGKSASSVVSDKPIQLTEEIKHVDQNVARYLDTFNRIKI